MRIRCGVYAITHTSGVRYIGGSTNIILRYTNHRYHLRRGSHGSKKLQSLWSSTSEDQWKFEILEECSQTELQSLEIRYLSQCEFLLNDRPNGWCHSAETRIKQSDGRALFLHVRPEARQELSDHARKQWADGNLGRTKK